MTDPILYILLRGDMASMNPGKGIAQACHAANLMVHEIRQQMPVPDVVEWLAQWESSAGGFGTTIVFQYVNDYTFKNVPITEPLIRACVADAIASKLAAGIVIDPTYPVRDGAVTHHVNVLTCGYIFGPRERCYMIVKNMVLMP